MVSDGMVGNSSTLRVKVHREQEDGVRWHGRTLSDTGGVGIAAAGGWRAMPV